MISRNGGDITNKIKKVPDVPSQISIKGLFQVRGEMFAQSEYDRPTFSQRQAAAYMRASDSKCDHISFAAFQIINGRLNLHDSQVNKVLSLFFSLEKGLFGTKYTT